MTDKEFDEVVEDLHDDTGIDPVEDAEDHKEEPKEDKHLPRGYIASKEEWVAAGKDPEDWVSPEVFKERGERIKMKAEYDNRFKNLSMYYQKQMEIQRNDLLARRDEAIDTADKAEVKRLDKELKELDQIEELNRNEEPKTVNKPLEVVEWEQENPWCNDVTDPRLALAQRVFKSAIDQGKTPATALRMVDKEIAAKFIDKSRKPAQIAEGSRAAPGRGDDGKPSMSNLSAEEKKIWEAGIFDSKDDFLKAVQDDRKAKAGKK